MGKIYKIPLTFKAVDYIDDRTRIQRLFDYFKKTHMLCGVEYAWNYHWSIRPFVQLSRMIQIFLYNRDIFWHNPIAGECTPGFECCNPDLIPEHIIRNEKINNILK